VRCQNARCSQPAVNESNRRARGCDPRALRESLKNTVMSGRIQRHLSGPRRTSFPWRPDFSELPFVDVPVAITKLISGRVRSVATQGLTARRDDTASESPRPSFAPQAVHVTLLIVRVPKYLSLHNDVLVRRKSPPWVTSSSRVRRYLAIFQMFISIEDLFWQRISSCEAQQCTTIHVATGGVGYV